ncbi:putative methyltransferase [Emiliania huxleyi virus 99B1]|nr:hypothetical protein EhVM1_000445 [Emiliania huxleyi virus M1]CAZ69762.1 putative methyltransferase [Emiliania huxleyi virus 99B1]|mmetsp:Transcript_22809/g.65113  ORF Transcript_22809/g.65113 Transcript_22809/m.65113 type:complete len:245 (-) Transcript_22809:4955-5689(-)
MKTLTFFLSVCIVTSALDIKPSGFVSKSNAILNTPIHFMPNHGLMGKFHASVAQTLEDATDAYLYEGVNPRAKFAKYISQYYKDSSVIDIGCGVGQTTFELNKFMDRSCKLIGIDASCEMLDMAKERDVNQDVEFHQLNAVDIKHKYDVAVISNLFHELPHQAHKEILNNLVNRCDDIWVLDYNPATLPPADEMLSTVREYEPFLADYQKHFSDVIYDTCYVHEVDIPDMPIGVKVWNLNKKYP